MILRCWIGIGQALKLSLRRFERDTVIWDLYFFFDFFYREGGGLGKAVEKWILNIKQLVHHLLLYCFL